MNQNDIIRAALSAPSGDNCQPFAFKWLDSGLEIWFKPERAKHFMDVNMSASMLALGGTIEAIKIAASLYNTSTSVTLHLPLSNKYSLAAALKFTNDQCPVDPLQPHIFTRATDRRCYRGGADHEVFSLVETEAALFPEIAYSTALPVESQLLDEILQADSVIFLHREAQEDLMRWLRLSDEEIAAHRDGMPWPTLGIKPHELLFLRMCRRWWIQDISNKLGGLTIARQVLKKQILSSARLLGLGVRSKSPNAIVEAGRLAYRIWVRLNAHSFGVQALSALPIFSLAASNAQLPRLRPEFVDLFNRASTTIRSAMDWTKDIQPVWLFRTGVTDPLTPSLRCPRLHPDEVQATDTAFRPGS